MHAAEDCKIQHLFKIAFNKQHEDCLLLSDLLFLVGADDTNSGGEQKDRVRNSSDLIFSAFLLLNRRLCVYLSVVYNLFDTFHFKER
jgi:hypothetical protein